MQIIQIMNHMDSPHDELIHVPLRPTSKKYIHLLCVKQPTN